MAISTRHNPVTPSPSSWKDVRVNVTDAAFARGGADVWVKNAGRDATLLHMIEVAHA